MATPVVMPRQGNTVESCIIVEWKKQPGDEIAEGEALCEVETDKAVMEVESPVGGSVLELFFSEGDLVPVLETIAAVGAPGEDASSLRPSGSAGSGTTESAAVGETTSAPDAADINATSASPVDGRGAGCFATGAQAGCQPSPST